MTSTKHLICFLIASLFGACTAKQQAQLQWYKGNLHTHSYWSDGNDYPEMIMKWYKDHDYNFVALSDHNTLAEGEKWVTIKKGTVGKKTLNEYLKTYGEKWVAFEEYKDHFRVRLKTLKEYRSLFEEKGEFLVIKSEEITDGVGRKPIHINVTNVQKYIEPQGGNTVLEVMQNNIDAVLKQRKITQEPMFPHLNHPNFGWAVTAEDIKKLEGERFLEIYNGHPYVHNQGDSLHSGTEQIWDEVITHYIMNGKPLIYGLAVDDAHHYREFDSTRANPGRGWIYVKSNGLTPDSLIAAMERGDFYASTGVRLEDIQFDGKVLSIDIMKEEDVHYKTQFFGTHLKKPGQPGALLETVKGPKATYTFTGDEMYVRAKIISDKLKKNPYSKGEVEVAWTQPRVNGEIK
jgi:hypothetical protein